MYIENSLLDLIISKLTIEYSGCHNSDSKNPLWGRAAYWRIYVGDTYIAKITTPVKSLEPTKKTLDKLFRAELKKRIEAIHERFTTDHYGNMQIEQRDPYSMKRLLGMFENKYYDLVVSNRQKIGA